MSIVTWLLVLQIPVFIGWSCYVKWQATEKKAANALFWFAMSMAASATYLLVVRFASGTTWHPLVFLPLNLAFLSLYLYIRYWQTVIPGIFTRQTTAIFLVLLGIEGATALLPVGAWWYTAEFSGKMVHFAFNIKKAMLLLFGLSAFWVWRSLFKSLRKLQNLHPYQSLAEALFHQLRWSFLLLPIVLLPPLAGALGYQGYAFYSLQGSLSLLVVGWMMQLQLSQINAQLVNFNISNAKSTSGTQHFQAFLDYVRQPAVLFQPTLRLQEVAQALALSPNYLSTIINTHIEGGFVEVINQHRIAALQEKFRRGEHLQKTIGALAEEVGFASKSGFQSVFRKQTGCSPSVWIKQHLAENGKE